MAQATHETGGGKPKSGKGKGAEKPGESTIARNRKAFFEYEVLEEFEAGMALLGTEVKSLRQGQIVLGDAYARFIRGELYLVNAHIPEYKQGGYTNHAPMRQRKLLLHKNEIARISRKIDEKGLTVIPLALYWKSGYAKVKIGVCRGKKLHDKRDAIAARDQNRAALRAERE